MAAKLWVVAAAASDRADPPPAEFLLSLCLRETATGPALNVQAGKTELEKLWRRWGYLAKRRRRVLE